ncbi:hypothetical protein T552_02403 [Pneumocystis carinii B80]|uniref:ATP synthase subunit d, mitochondrial n=1 Tax=Pneumocystis carinii (strain B80) TaxID=1408658 RepID=A0A0W4ZGC8_PNEC8|nr:hypothetical protein T552_02403 [Pneumocystis carinii B80]KTW27425.1 hypothetical protein T552_02403 [Pneumocystis carinii B80]
MAYAAAKIDWIKLRSSYSLSSSVISSLFAFHQWNLNTRAKIGILEKQLQDIDFTYYRSILKNKSIVNQIEKDLKTFRPVKYRVNPQIKAIQQFETKAIENATKVQENANKELIELETALLNIQQALPIDELTVEDVLTACPKIEEKVEEMVKREKWSVPGYKEKFGDLAIM